MNWHKRSGIHNAKKHGLAAILACFLFSVLSCNAQNLAGERGDGKLVVFYNVENLFHPDDDPHTNDNDFTPEGSKRYTSKVYSDRIKRIRGVLDLMDISLGGDLLIAGLAEVENEQVLKDLCDAGMAEGFRYIHSDSPDPRGIDVALIYKEKHFIPDTHFVTRIKEPYKAGKGKPRTRDILFVVGHTASEEFIISVNHWPSRRGGVTKTEHKRLHTAKICRRVTDSLSNKLPGHSIIVMGDLNDNPGDKSVYEIMKAGEDHGDPGSSRLYNPFIRLFEEGHGSYVYNKNWNMYDQILVSPSINVSQAGTFMTPNMLNEEGSRKGHPKRSYSRDSYIEGFSDHLPVYIIID